ncbi:MAG: M16 family metallopeptidase [Flavobacteriales bacterium]
MQRLLPFLSLLLPFSLLAQDFKVDFTEYDLDNGLHVILHEDHSAPVVATTIMYDVGSKHEDPNVTGTAHYVEHLMFEGSKNIDTGMFAHYAEAAGGRLNANTSWDRTFYFELLPSNQLELGLWLESERLMHARIADRKKGVETQRKVVMEERKQRVDNQPYGGFHMELKKRLFKKHPYKHPLIGHMDHIKKASKKDLNAIYDKYYVPSNAVLVVAGDIDIDSTKKLIKKYYAPIEKEGDPEEVKVDEPELMDQAISDTIYDQVQLPGVVHGWKTPGVGSKDYYATDMLFRILARGESSRMKENIVQKKQLAAQLFASPFPMYDDPGMSLSFALANSNVKADSLNRAMEKEYERIRKEGVSQKEYEKVLDQIEAELIQANSSIRRKATNLATYYLLRGNTNLINTEVEQYKKVTPADIKRVANKYLVPSNRVTLYYLPKSAK